MGTGNICLRSDHALELIIVGSLCKAHCESARLYAHRVACNRWISHGLYRMYKYINPPAHAEGLAPTLRALTQQYAYKTDSKG